MAILPRPITLTKTISARCPVLLPFKINSYKFSLIKASFCKTRMNWNKTTCHLLNYTDPPSPWSWFSVRKQITEFYLFTAFSFMNIRDKVHCLPLMNPYMFIKLSWISFLFVIRWGRCIPVAIFRGRSALPDSGCINWSICDCKCIHGYKSGRAVILLCSQPCPVRSPVYFFQMLMQELFRWPT